MLTIRFLLLAVLLLSVPGVPTVAAEVFLVRDYQSGVTLANGQLEVSLDYLAMNETLDLFNLREERIGSVSQVLASERLGDLQGGRLLVSYGLQENLMLSAGYRFRDFDVTFADYQVDSYELAVTARHNFYGRPATDTAYAFGILGARHNAAADYATTRIDEINYLARKVSPRYSISEVPGRIVISDGTLTYSSPVVNPDGSFKDPLALGLRDSSDTSVYLRSGVGRRWERFNVALFGEVGYTSIRGALDQNLSLYGIEDDNPVLDRFDLDLGRDETWLKAGIDLYYETLYGVAMHLAYSYLLLQRDGELGRYDNNQILQAELILRLSRRVALTLGGEYYRHQFNGVVPLLYNRYTQSSFHRDYGIVQAGITVVFGR